MFMDVIVYFLEDSESFERYRESHIVKFTLFVINAINVFWMYFKMYDLLQDI